MLNIEIAEDNHGKKTVALHGRLDTETANDFNAKLQEALGPEVEIVVFDMAGLEFISSAGIGSLFRVQKQMKARGGRTLMLSMQPQVSKVLEIVKTVDLKAVFRDTAELDEYLKGIQS